MLILSLHSGRRYMLPRAYSLDYIWLQRKFIFICNHCTFRVNFVLRISKHSSERRVYDSFIIGFHLILDPFASDSPVESLLDAQMLYNVLWLALFTKLQQFEHSLPNCVLFSCNYASCNVIIKVLTALALAVKITATAQLVICSRSRRIFNIFLTSGSILED